MSPASIGDAVKDYTAIAVLDASNGKMVALERFNQVSGWQLQRDRLTAIGSRNGDRKVVWAEANSIGEPNDRSAEPPTVCPSAPSTPTPKPKRRSSNRYRIFTAIERQDITLLDDPVLLTELADYSYERLSNGGYRTTGAPSGAHERHRHRIRPGLVFGARFTGSRPSPSRDEHTYPNL